MRQLFAYNQSIFFLPYYWEDIFGMVDVTAFGIIRQQAADPVFFLSVKITDLVATVFARSGGLRRSRVPGNNKLKPKV